MTKKREPDIRSEYAREDLGKGVRGKFFADFQAGTNLVLLSPDVAAVFPTEEAVNKALRTLIAAAQRTVKPRTRAAS